MARPSRNIDLQLLEAGRALLPETGCAGLSVRQLAARAGVNLGMFHYHFRSKDNFLRTLLQGTYDEMFARLETSVRGDAPRRDSLRAALLVVAGFMRDNRRLMLRLIADAICGQAVAADFLRNNLPRHLGVLASLMREAQQRGELIAMPGGQMLGFVVGAVGLPIFASAMFETGSLPAQAVLNQVSVEVLPDAAIAQRIDLALAALAVPGSKS
jgi:AcrR family transcriptional regulator